MQKEKQISDELLTRYLSGQTSDAEDAEVLDYCEQGDQSITELSDIAESILVQRQSQSQAHKHPTRAWWPAAACAVLIIGVFFSHALNSHKFVVDQAPAYAGCDTISSFDTITSIELPCNEE